MVERTITGLAPYFAGAWFGWMLIVGSPLVAFAMKMIAGKLSAEVFMTSVMTFFAGVAIVVLTYATL